MVKLDEQACHKTQMGFQSVCQGDVVSIAGSDREIEVAIAACGLLGATAKDADRFYLWRAFGLGMPFCPGTRTPVHNR